MIPESAADLMSWDKKSFAHLALTLADGTPPVHTAMVRLRWHPCHHQQCAWPG